MKIRSNRELALMESAWGEIPNWQYYHLSPVFDQNDDLQEFMPRPAWKLENELDTLSFFFVKKGQGKKGKNASPKKGKAAEKKLQNIDPAI